MPTVERYLQYELLRREDGSLWELGRGAMGITYKAYDTNLQFTVALKIINSAYLENDTARQRFLREARAAAALRHPNVASVFNLGTQQNKYFYVMEYIDGETVEARVKREGPMEPAEALNIALQVSRALAVAAKQRLVHRDLKPSNLMLVAQEDELSIKVIDFGLAKVAKVEGEDSGALTVGGFVGTPHFASPEQVEEGEVDIRSDFYSLGATLYFLVTGQAPFTGSVGQVMSQQMIKALPMEPLAHLPPCVASLLQHMMEKDRNNRPQTPQELQREILVCLEEIRNLSSSVHRTDEPSSAFATLDLGSGANPPSGIGAVLAENYKLVEEPVESSQGRHFVADDLRHNRRVSLLVLSSQFLSDTAPATRLEEAVRLLHNAPHPMLREIYSLETGAECNFLVEEYVVGPSLLEVLRVRGALGAPEVVQLLNLLAPLADHARDHRLQPVDLSLSGIHLTNRAATESGIQPELFLQRPLTAWERLEPKVDAIDFTILLSDTGAWLGSATRIGSAASAAESGPRGSGVRLLSLLAYELLGGPRAKVERTGQYTPLAALTEEGNKVLRQGMFDECPSAEELARQVAATVSVTRLAPDASEQKKQGTETPDSGIPPPARPGPVSSRRKHPAPQWRWILVCFGVLLAIAFCLIPWILRTEEIPVLTIHTDPANVAIFLDGKPPNVFPDAFFHVPFGTHQLSAVLSNREVVTKEFQVRKGIGPEIRIVLEERQELPSLSIHTEPAGASILLDGKPPESPANNFTHVPFGSHQLSATLPDYYPIKQEIQISNGTPPKIQLQFRPIQEIAALSITTEPAGASILLDGKPPQSPPRNTFTHVPFGKHQVTATADGRPPIKQDIDVHKGMAPQLRLQLDFPQEIAALSVVTEPAGASILLDGKPPQSSPNTFMHVPFGEHQITATMDGYVPIKKDIAVRDGMDPQVHLQLKPRREIAALSVVTEPAGASILLDGKPPQSSPNTFIHVPFGEYHLTATLDGYVSIEREIEVSEGMNPQVHLELEPLPEIAALSVTTEPAGASILLDGKPPQSSPNTFIHVPFGEHHLTATLDGYVSIERDIAVRKGMDPQVHLQLAPIQEVAALSVVTEPAGASTLLDGNPPQSPPNIFTRVPFGTHYLVATLNKYLPTKQNVDVQKGISEIQVKLKQAPPEDIGWIMGLDRGQLEETRKEYVGALQIYRELVEKGRETFRPDVAKTLNNMAVLDSRLGLVKEARQEYAEALQIYRELAQKNQETYRPLVATAVNNLANADSETGRLEDARREFEEALQIRRELAEKNPEAYRPFVARTLNNLAVLDSRQNKLEKARNEFAEALRIYRNLDQNVPETYRPSMAMTLYNLADVDVQQRRFEDARKEYAEALQIYESLAKQDPGQFMPKIKRVEKLLQQLSGH